MIQFLKDLIDNDTLIIAGVLALAAFADTDLRQMVAGGLLAFLGQKAKNNGP